MESGTAYLETLGAEKVSKVLASPNDPAFNDWSKPRGDRTVWKVKASQALEELTRTEPRALDKSLVERVMHGDLNADAKVDDTPVIRPFISSTFTDTKAERDLLILDVYQFLKTFARSMGVEFKQPAEMRWGIRKESSDSHQTSAICMHEIHECIKESKGIAYVLLLADKYGYRPFPAVVARDELDKLKDALRAAGKTEALSLAEQWFKLDTNSIPEQYILQPCSSVEPNEWWGIFATMEKAFREVCPVLDEGLPKVPIGLGGRSQFYIMSVTHNEAEQGMFSLPEDQREKQCFVFRRRIQDIQAQVGQPDSPEHPLKFYLDLAGSGPDTDAIDLMTELREHTVPNNLSASRLKDYETHWGPGISDKTHMKYLHEFSDYFCDLFMQDILRVAKANQLHRDEYYEEAAQHLSFAATRSNTCFVTPGIRNIMDSLETYLKQPNSAAPFVVHGRSGAGKTSIMAKLAYTCRETIKDAHLIVRFLGTTRMSGTSRSLMGALCFHLMRIYPEADDPTALPSAYNELKSMFKSLLTRPASRGVPLIIVLDSLDQLTDDDNGRGLDWLPMGPLDNVHIVLSTLPDEGDCFSVLCATIPDSHKESCFHEVKPLHTSEAEQIVDGWLNLEQRKLTAPQKSALMTAFHNIGSPLYLKIAFEQTLSWKSYMDPPPLGADVRGLIVNLFDGLETVHGFFMVAHSLAYITVARSGLSDNELEDILSCDDDVLDDVFEWWTPPIRRVPPLLWKRLRSDLSRYLVQRGADGGTAVVSFYHRQFWEAVRDKYLKTTDVTNARHIAVADYFAGKWADTPKPYRNGVADRQVPRQPIVLHGMLGTPVCVLNHRKLGEEVYNRLQARDYKNCKNCLGSLEYSWAVCLAGLSTDLIAQYLEFENECKDSEVPELDEIIEFSDFFTAQAHLLSEHPKLTIPNALNEPDKSPVRAHALMLEPTYRPHLGMYYRWVNKLEYKNPTQLIITEHSLCVWKALFSFGGDRILTVSDDHRACIFDSLTGRLVRDLITGAKESLTSAAWAPDDQSCVVGGRDSVFWVFDPNTGKCLKRFETQGWVTFLQYAPNGERLYVGTSWNLYIYEPATDGVHKHAKLHEKGIRAMACTPDSQKFVTGAFDKKTRVWDVSKPAAERPTMIREWSHEGTVNAASFHCEKPWLALASDDKKCTIVNWETGAIVFTINGMGKYCALQFSPYGEYLACGGGTTKAVELWDTNTWMKASQLVGHSDVIWHIEFSNDGKSILSSGGTLCSTARLWDVDLALKAGRPAGHESVLRHVNWSPTGRHVATCGDDFCVRVTDSITGHEYFCTNLGMVCSNATFNTKGDRLLAVTDHPKAYLLDSTSGQTIWEGIAQHDKKLLHSAFSEDGQLAALAGNGMKASVWTVGKGEDGKDKSLTNVSVMNLRNAGFFCNFSPNSQYLVVRTDKVMVGIYSRKHNWAMKFSCTTPESTSACEFSPDGKWMGAPSDKGNVFFFDVSSLDQLVKDDVVTLEPTLTLKAHHASAKEVSFSPDMRFVVTGSHDKHIKLFSFPALEELAMFNTQGAIMSVRMSPDGRHVAAGDFGGILYVLEIANLPEWREVEWVNAVKDYPMTSLIGKHNLAVWKARLSNDGTMIASASDDFTARLFDTKSGRQLCTLGRGAKTFTSVAFSPDDKVVVTGSREAKVTAIDIATEQPVWEYKTNGWCTALDYSPTGEYVAIGSSFSFVLYEIASGSITELKGHEKTVRGIAFSSDGTRLVSGAFDKTVRLWEVPSGTLLHTWSDHEQDISCVALSPDNRFAASASNDKYCFIYDLQSNQIVQRITNGIGKMCACDFSPNGKLFLCAGGGPKQIEIYDTMTWNRLATLRGHSDVVWSCFFSKDSKSIVSAAGTLDRTIRLWDVDKALAGFEKFWGHADIIRDVRITPDQKYVITASEDRCVRVIQLSDGSVKNEFVHDAPVASAVCSPNGRFLAVATKKPMLHIYDMATGAEICQDAGPHDKPMLLVRFSRDGKKLAVSGNGMLASVWNVADDGKVSCYNKVALKNAGFSVDFSPDGRKVVVRYSPSYVRVFNTETLEPVGDCSTNISMMSNIFSRDGKHIYTTGEDGAVRIYDTSSLSPSTKAEPVYKMVGPCMKSCMISVAQDSPRLAACCDDMTVRVWDLEMRSQVSCFNALGAVQAVDISKDGRTVVAGDFSGIIYVLKVVESEYQRANPIRIQPPAEPLRTSPKAAAPASSSSPQPKKQTSPAAATKNRAPEAARSQPAPQARPQTAPEKSTTDESPRKKGMFSKLKKFGAKLFK